MNSIPPELLLGIAKELADRDVSRLSRTDRQRQFLLRDEVFRRNIESHGTSCLPSIASLGNLALIQSLREFKNFSADARNGNGDTALLCAIDEGHDDVAQTLIEIGGGQLDLRNGHRNCRPLTLAITLGRKEVVRSLLLIDGIMVNGERCTDYGMPLFEACRTGNEDILKLLLARDDVDVSTTNEDGQTGLHVAAIRGLPHIAEALLGHGKVSKAAKDSGGLTALSLAILHGNYEVLAVLDKYGVQPTAGDLQQAGGLGNHFSCRRLSKHHNLPRHRTRYFTITTCAAIRGHAAWVSQLLPLVDEEEHQDALLFAAAYGHTKIVEELLVYVRPDFQDEKGRTPEWYARRWGHTQIVGLFEGWKLAQDGCKSQKRKRMAIDMGCEELRKRNRISVED
ncbi:hypothetical protein NQ176_g1251 [Zarea fungicola]|uniref:Uncharacterized protein n=1 Tax=Zarea fungicola TaxID=93591 RepID=A0ACC1NUX0_9HYPO|nr:hypothetical protein NQ176_g1251 [Lecanicillium fungicola]